MDTAQFFLNPRSIRNHVPEPTFERGMSLYITQQVMSCTVNHSNSNEWEIEGTVQVNTCCVMYRLMPRSKVGSGTCARMDRGLRKKFALPIRRALCAQFSLTWWSS